MPHSLQISSFSLPSRYRERRIILSRSASSLDHYRSRRAFRGPRPPADAGVRYRSIRIERRFPAHTTAIFENHVAANAIHEGAEFLHIPYGVTLLGAEETSEGFLHKVINIRTIAPDVVENLVPKLQAQALDGWFVQIHRSAEGARRYPCERRTAHG